MPNLLRRAARPACALAVLAAAAFFPLRNDGFSDRTIVAAMDGKFALVVQDDRRGVWGPFFEHVRTVYYRVGKSSGKTVERQYAATGAAVPFGSFSHLAVTEDFELAKRGLSFAFRLPDGSDVLLDEPLSVTDFVTKTDPDYVRFVHFGSGSAKVSGNAFPVRIAVESTAYRRLSDYYLKPGTRLDGYFGAVFDPDGTSRFYDLSEMLERGAGETYVPHAFLLTKRPDGSVSRSFGPSFGYLGDSRWALLDVGVAGYVFENLRPMGPTGDADRYSFAVSKPDSGSGSGVAVLNFLNVGSRP